MSEKGKIKSQCEKIKESDAISYFKHISDLGHIY